VVAANYNAPGQIVISGDVEAVTLACTIARELGAKRTLMLPVSGMRAPETSPLRVLERMTGQRLA